MTNLDRVWQIQMDAAKGRSPLYERIATGIHETPAVAEILLDAPSSQRFGVLLLAAVHYLLLKGAEHPLRGFYPDLGGTDAGDPFPSFQDFCFTHRDEIRALLKMRRTQTNEVARAAALILGLPTDTPIAIVEPGASAGLNLMLDRFFYRFGEQTLGDPASPVQLEPELRAPVPVPKRMPQIVFRIGLDLAPKNVFDEDEMLWLRACIWPEHRHRVERFEAALQIARSEPPEIVQGSVAGDLVAIAERVPSDALLVISQSTMLMYVRDEDLHAYADALKEISKSRPVCWLALDSTQGGNKMFERSFPTVHEAYGLWTADVRDGDVTTRFLATAGYQGEWIEWMA